MANAAANPYVGPRTFTYAERERFFGREREARDLLSLVIAERLVLFYAQSGAGKSSLLNTRLIPQLKAAGYAVLPMVRVGGELPEGVSDVDNIFVFNCLLHLDQRTGSDPRRFAHMTLAAFLPRLTSPDGESYYYDDNAEPQKTWTTMRNPCTCSSSTSSRKLSPRIWSAGRSVRRFFGRSKRPWSLIRCYGWC